MSLCDTIDKILGLPAHRTLLACGVHWCRIICFRFSLRVSNLHTISFAETSAIVDGRMSSGTEKACTSTSQQPVSRLPAGDENMLTKLAVLIAGHRERHSKAHMVASSGGGQHLQNTEGSWDVIARVWPSSLCSVAPVHLGVDTGSSSLSQLATLLVMPKMLTNNAPEHVALAGWSLGVSLVQVLAALLATCHGSPSSICLFEGRSRKPFVGMPRLRAIQLQNLKPIFHDAQHAFHCRRDSLWLTQCVPVLVNFALSCEIHSGLLLIDSQMFEKDEVVFEKDDIYSMAGSALQYPETDHFVVAVHNAWDAGRRIRANGVLIHSATSQPRQAPDRDPEERRCTARAM